MPGFAGVYFDTDNVLVILLVDPTKAEAARKEVMHLGLPATEARIRTAKYDFAQLFTWKQAFASACWRNDVTMLGIDEKRNAVHVGVRPGASMDPAHACAREAGMPGDALYVETFEVRW